MKSMKPTAVNRLANTGRSRCTRNRLSGNGHGRRPTALTVKAAPAPKPAVHQLDRKPDHEPRLLQTKPQIDHRPLERGPVSPWRNPTQLASPSFLMNFPFSYATGWANNPWMEDLKDDQRQPDFTRAAVQFLELYRFVSSEGLTYLLPTPRGADLQDLVYTANLGIVLAHLPEKNTVVISNFASRPRQGETPVGVRFFEHMGYEVHVAPARFEGEAELKHLHDNIYIGGYGIRSEKATYEWMEEKFNMRVIKLREVEPYLYHLDCSIFPITKENTLVCTDLFSRKEVAELETVTNIIPVSVEDAYSGICNSVRLSKLVLNSSHIHELKTGTTDYQSELQKNRRLEDIASNLALDVAYFNLSEFHKSGALLSCMIMHLNRDCYRVALTA